MIKTNSLNNYIELDKFNSTLVITCRPYKSGIYALKGITYYALVFFCIICIIFYKEIWSYCSNNDIEFIALIFGPLIPGFALQYSNLIFSFFKNSLLRNYFLNEKLFIHKDKLEYSNSFGKKISCNISHLKVIDFNFNKAVGEFSGVPFHIPNYTPIIVLKNQNDEPIGKIMYSIKKEDVFDIYTTITNHLIEIGCFYKVYNIDYKDKITDIWREGKKIIFISAQEYYELNRRNFSKEQKDFFDTAIEDTIDFKSELAKAIKNN